MCCNCRLLMLSIEEASPAHTNTKKENRLRMTKRINIFVVLNQMSRERTQSTKLSSMILLDGSTGRRPVISSKSMTPNEKTSDFSVSFPLDAYSGAKYLKISINMISANVHPITRLFL